MAARAELPPLIPRDVLFGNPEKVSPKISPDGKRMAWIAPDQKNVRQVWVKTIGANDDKVVTDDKKRNCAYEWAQNSKVLLYMQDHDGDEDFHVYGVDLAAGTVRDFTPHEKIQARISGIDENFPDEVLLSINIRDRRLHDVYRLNLTTGELTPTRRTRATSPPSWPTRSSRSAPRRRSRPTAGPKSASATTSSRLADVGEGRAGREPRLR